LENERDGGGLFERKTLGIGEAVDFGAADQLGTAAIEQVTEVGELRAVIVAAGEASGALAAADPWSQENFLVGPYCGDAGSNFVDDTSDVAARDMRERNGETRNTLAYPKIQMVEGAGVDADESFAEARFGFGDVGVAEDVGSAVVIEKDRFHRRAES